MTLTFDATLGASWITCQIGSDTALATPVFCFSLMAPNRVVSGGTQLRSVAGYSEVRLPDLAPGRPHTVTLAHKNPDFGFANRAWLPLGAYLRTADGRTLALPALPAGVAPVPAPAVRAPDGVRLIPQPTAWRPAEGTLRASNFAASDPALAPVAALAARNGLGAFLASDGTPLDLLRDPTLAEEAYVLSMTPRRATLSASGAPGFFYGGITLLTLIHTHAGNLPCGTITDAPGYAWRGQHLDCARHFYQPATLHRLCDLMALLKLNRFHWHFADDEAFRLEVDCAPDLWQKTAFRGEDEVVPGVFGGGIRAGGSYSKADAAALVAHAAALHIQVLPEIEVPAHAFAMNRVIPGLRDPEDRGTEASVQGYRENAVNPALPATWDFMQDLAAEVGHLFPIGILHLGCDELAPSTWDGSPAVDRLKAEHGFATRDDVQGWMMARLAAYLTAQGLRPAAWEEAAKGKNGGIGHAALMFSWTGQGAGVAAARAGYDVVMCPAQNTYFDMAHSADPGDWGAGWAAFIDLEEVMNWSPIPKGAEDIAARVVGVEGCYWSEFTTEDRQIEPMLAPRILGLAAKAWDRADRMDGPALRRLAGVYAVVFDAIGWVWHRGA